MKLALKLIAVVPFFIALSASAATKKPAAVSPQTVVSNLYEAHKSKSDPLAKPANPKILGRYFTERFAGLYIQNQKDPSSELNQAFPDILFTSLNKNITDFRVREPLMTMEGATVAVNFFNAGLAHQVVFFLTETKSGWRIYDIRFEDGTSLHSILEKKI